MLARDGLGRLTTSAVAERAGVSVGSLYQYFPNREALLGALVERRLDQTFAEVVAMLPTLRALPLGEALQRLLLGLHAVYQAQARFVGALRSATGLSDRERLHHLALARYVALLAPELAARADVAVADPAVAAWLMVHAADGVMRAVALADEGTVDLSTLLREASALMLGYLTAGRPFAASSATKVS